MQPVQAEALNGTKKQQEARATPDLHIGLQLRHLCNLRFLTHLPDAIVILRFLMKSVLLNTRPAT